MKILTGVAVGLALLLSPATGLAQAPQLPVGEARGVKVIREHGAIVVVFTAKAAKLHKRLAGKDVIVSCTTLLEDGTNTGSQRMRVPVRGRKLFTGDLTRPIDYCRLWLPRKKNREKRILVSVPLTQKGAVFVDEEKKTRTMMSLLLIADLARLKQKLDGPPTYDQLVKFVPRRARAEFSKFVVPLPALSATPPPHKVGYYSDGGEQLGVAVVSASGRPLFIRYGPDEVLTTNVSSYMFNEPA